MATDGADQFGLLLAAFEEAAGSTLWHDPVIVDHAVAAACDGTLAGYQVMIGQRLAEPAWPRQHTLGIIDRIQEELNWSTNERAGKNILLTARSLVHPTG